MVSSSSHPRRSPRLADLARVRELTETDTEKEKRLRRAQYSAKQDSVTDGERKERNERRRAAYRARISAANRQPASVQVCKSAGEHKAESSCIFRRSPRIQLQQRALQLEKSCIAMEERRSSMSESDKQQIVEQQRRVYQMRRTTKGDTSNNVRRQGLSSASVQVCKSAGEHRAESSCIVRRSPRIQLQQRAPQLEMSCIAMEERRSSISESDKQQILEQRRRAYQMRRTTKAGAANNVHRPGPSSASFLPRRSPRFSEKIQCQDNEEDAEASRKRKGKSVMVYEKKRRPNSGIPGRKAGAIVIRSTEENNIHHSTDDSSSEDGEQQLADSGVPHHSGKENINSLELLDSDNGRNQTRRSEIDLQQRSLKLQRLARIRAHRLLRHRQLLLSRRLRPGIEHSPPIGENSSCGGLVDVSVTYGSCNVARVTASTGILRLPVSSETNEQENMFDVKLTGPPLRPSPLSHAVRQRRYTVSRTVQQRIVMRAKINLERRIRRLRQTSSEDIQSNAQKFRKLMDEIRWGHCEECKTKFLDIPAKGICNFCVKDKKQNPRGVLLFSEANNMDPGDVPEELSRLTDLEKLLIARIHPMMSVYRVKGQQYKYGGNVINFMQDVNEIAKVLPHKPSDLAAILIVNRTGSRSTKEFVVRREFVRRALWWLKWNHLYYQDIEINEANIDCLPEDSVPDDLPCMNEDDKKLQEHDDDHNGPPELQEQGVLHVDDFQIAGTIGAFVQPDQQKCIMKALEGVEADKTNADLPFTGEVVSEFTKVGYITMAFPTLFPYGRADLREDRPRKVGERQYFQYLMRYHDGRFARDSRFRYFALNSSTRWHALSLGSVYVKLNPTDGELSIESIRDMVTSGDIQLMSRVSYYAKQIRGTRAYWYSRLKELIAMVKQLGSPTIFFTLSAADLQWPELYAILDPENKLASLDPLEKRRERARLLNENPLIASWFLKKRVDVFFKEYLKKEFSVVDHWYRYEWQNRGSGHVHGFLWLKDRPNYSNIGADEVVKKAMCDYFDKLVCTTNPDPAFTINIQDHPCAKKIPLGSNVENDDADYASLVNFVMRHTKCGTYCLRKSKITKKQGCRFRFPRELLDASKIVEEPPNSNMYRFVGRRNDTRVNSHNRGVVQTWRGNIDWSAVTTIESVTQYIGKYASKSEPASNNYIDTMRGILDDKLQPCLDSTSVIKKLFMKSASERDISAQEVCHLLMGWNLTESSRKVVLLNLSETSLFSSQLRWKRHVGSGEQGSTNPAFFRLYLERPDHLRNMSLLEVAKTHHFDRGRWRKYRVECVVRIVPEIGGKVMPNTDQFESFCRQQVLLNSCYRSVEEAQGDFLTWAERYAELHRANENEDGELAMVEDEFEEEIDLGDETLEEEWMIASRMAPNFGPVVDTELGLRSIDKNHDWEEGFRSFPLTEEDIVFTSRLGEAGHEVHSTTGADTCLTVLSDQQKAALDLVQKSLNDGVSIRLIVSGGAGTGKSTLINTIVRSTREMFGNDKVVRVMAPTGVAAFNIGGSTIHHELAITTDRNQSYKKLETQRCGRMQVDFSGTKLIIIDEYSMIGKRMLGNIDLRCRDIFATDEPFGNVSIMLVGDIRQLPPVFDSPLYAQGGRDRDLELTGYAAYSVFEHCVHLKEVFRQSGTEEQRFREALLRLSDGKSTIEDWKLFKSREYMKLTVQEKDNFKNAIRLFPKKEDAAAYNYKQLEKLGYPVARVMSTNNCQTAEHASTDDAKGLQKIVLLSKESRVMLRKNICTKFGLVNGSTGTVVDVVYEDGKKPPTHMPIAVMVRFDKYTGPQLYDEPNVNVIPIVPAITNWISSSGVTCQRKQFPLILCWAITVHKSQGLTLDQAVVDIGAKESLGLTFVALSRTRRLSDLAFDPMFSFERIAKIGECKALPERRQEEERLQELSQHCRV